MRQIKFRVWDKKNKAWVGADCGGVMNLRHSLESNCFLFDNDSFDIPKDIEVSEFTGLTDKNGKEIYEGDVLKAFMTALEDKEAGISSGYYDLGEVAFHPNAAQFVIRKGDKCASIGNDVEIIGNIYQNSELIKSNEKETN
jgi:uncharacterized phage protein (TIGR01671 family)